MPPRNYHSGGGQYGFDKPPEQIARDRLRFEETYGRMLTDHAHRANILRGLSEDFQSLPMSAMRTGIPDIHEGMSAPDIAKAQRMLNLARGRPEWYNPMNPQDASTSTPARAARPITPPAVDGPLAGLGVANTMPTAALSAPAQGAGAGVASGIQNTVAAAMARMKPAAPTALDGLQRTPTGLQAPAIRQDGSQMRNPDGSQRFVGSLPNRVPATVESRVTTPVDFNYRGERPVESVRNGQLGGPGIEVDPRRDLTKNWLPAGDPLLPKNATSGVVVDRRYQDPNNPVGFAATGPAKGPVVIGEPGYKPPGSQPHTAGAIGPPVTPLDGLTNPNGTTAGPTVPSRTSMIAPPVSPQPLPPLPADSNEIRSSLDAFAGIQQPIRSHTSGSIGAPVIPVQPQPHTAGPIGPSSKEMADEEERKRNLAENTPFRTSGPYF